MQLRKKWTLRIDGRDTRVTVVRDGRGSVWVETESGETIADALVLDSGRTVSLRRGTKAYLVDVTPPGSLPVRALVNGIGGPVEFLDELAAAAQETAKESMGSPELRAEMPGLVVEVKVSVGQKIQAGDPAIVLEAMKMQNELTSPLSGVVEQILVKAGESVDTGALLMRLMPAAEEAQA